MNISELPPEILRLGTIPETQPNDEWTDYRSEGIEEKHIPVLLEIVRHSPEFWADDVDDDHVWLPMHAWRALSQLNAQEAIPDLIAALRWIDEEDSDLVQEDLPEVFARFGPPAAPALTEYLFNAENDIWARTAAAEGLRQMAERNPDFRDEAIRILSQVLERYADQDESFNGLIVNDLAKLKAVEAAPLVQQAFEAGRVEEIVMGDYEDYQVRVGLLQERQTPRQNPFLLNQGLSDGVTLGENQINTRERVIEKKEKQKRKQAKNMRQKNRKKKKKK